MPLIIIVILSVFIVSIITIVIFRLTRSKDVIFTSVCDNSSDCSNGYYCTENPDSQKNVCQPSNKQYCYVQPSTKLLECTPGKDDCKSCANTINFSCIVVDKDHPYTWKKGNDVVKVPDSPEGKGWCLPKVKDKYCNPLTSEYILIDSGNNAYEWGCLCKYPNLITNASPGEDCSIVLACNENVSDPKLHGELVVPLETKCSTDKDCKSGDKCLPLRVSGSCDTDKNNMVCHTSWSKNPDIQKTVDPLLGQCTCPNQDDYQCVKTGADSYQMNCVPDPCYPYTKTSGDYCKPQPGTCLGNNTPDFCCRCPPGYLRCPEDITSNNPVLCDYCMNHPTCIPDPCSPGHYDPQSQSCVCPGDTWCPLDDPQSPVGQICRNVCEQNGPCGNRGDCYLPKDKDGNKICLMTGKERTPAKCCNCKLPNINTPTDPYCDTEITCQPNSSACISDSDCCSQDCSGNHFFGYYCRGTIPLNTPCKK